MLRGLRIRRATHQTRFRGTGSADAAARVERTAAGLRALPIAARTSMGVRYLRVGPAKSRVSRR